MVSAFVFALICTLLLPVYSADATIAFSNSFFSVIYFAVLLKMTHEDVRKECDYRKKKYTNVLGFFFSAFTGCGFAIRETGGVPYTSAGFLISVLLYTRVFAILLRAFWTFLGKAEVYLSQENDLKRGQNFASKIADVVLNVPVLGAAVLLLCWLPCYLAIFPGNFVYDATGEYNQIINGYDGNYPILHSVLITRIMSLMYAWTGSYNAGIAVFTIAQMILLAILFRHILHTFYKHGVHRVLLIVLFAYYALFPTIHLLVTSSVRDVMFSGLLTYTVFMLYQMFRDKRQFFCSTGRPIQFGIVFALTVLSRNNNAGIAALLLIVLACILIWIAVRKVSPKGAAILVAASIGSYVLIGSVLTAVCQPLLPAGAKSSLSLLTQPIARAYILHKDQWSQEDTQELAKYFYLDYLTYVDVNADFTKNCFRDKSDIEYFTQNFNLNIEDLIPMPSSEEDGMLSFLKLWVKIGMKYPGDYLDAILANTRQMWFPDSVIDGYLKSGAYQQWDKCYFYYVDELEAPAEFGGMLPAVHPFYNAIALRLSFERVPVISMLFSIGFQFWVLLNACGYVLYRRAKQLYCPILVMLCYAVISMLTPLVLLRYYAAMFFAVPIVIVFMLQPMRLRHEGETQEC